MRTVLVLLIFVSLNLAQTFPSNMQFDRSSFGKSRVGCWSDLTPFEQNTLDNAHLARTGNPDALLALAIMASGDVRDQGTFESYRKRIMGFLRKHKNQLNNTTTQKARAKQLFDLMNEHFFNLSPGSNKLQGYRFEQSQFTEIFRSKKFNCISSSILYHILLSYDNIPAQGVLLPGHAFIQLDLSSGPVNVETTSKQGFDIKHTRESVERNASAWASARDIEGYSWNDYLNRQYISAFDLIYHNFRNQHTAQNRMAFRDRFRLIEMRFILDPSDQHAFEDLLSVYYNEANYLRVKQKAALQKRFFTTISSFFGTSTSMIQSDNYQVLFQQLHLFRITALAPSNYEQGYQMTLEFLRRLPYSMKHNQSIQNNTLVTINVFFNYLTKRKEPHRYIKLLQETERAFGREFPQMKQSYFALYVGEGNRYWDTGMWNKTIEQLELALPYAPNQSEKNKVLTNIDAAYHNHAAIFVRKKQYREADAVLARCLKKYPSAKKSKALRKKIKPKVK